MPVDAVDGRGNIQRLTLECVMSDAFLRFASLSCQSANFGNRPPRNVDSERHLLYSRLPKVLVRACLSHSDAVQACPYGEL
eukprot:2469248-Pleurochrysis_carterae.AAC.1